MGDGEEQKKHKYGGAGRALCAFLLIFLILAAITLLILWLIYRPTKPNFTLVSFAIYQLNLTSPPLLSATMQFTLLTRNSHPRLSYHYDHLSAFVSYKNEAITPPVSLPLLSHGAKSTVAISVLDRGPVPVSVSVMNGLAMDEAYGMVGLRVVLKGKLRYKGGAIKSRRYGVCVECDVLVGFNKQFGAAQLSLLPSSSPQCNTHV
ncbi:PREDICTED: LOW QUALITY PROTEIN: NDR1/HIN1-like protein 12 [Ipomoea nil]|uniref:LOW QUALITY PROTEIN: NDR1/HIN1-like protein 12 n=1 Tax=Ipomoea nil TaxID=35883 RepID=UPI0009008F52|nr:PREDICTED: LOW QUALITY PROTEIN: NDR1/HIN1-like protein 12 [Ipomoea nil]